MDLLPWACWSQCDSTGNRLISIADITSCPQLRRAEVFRGLGNFLNMDRPEHHSIDCLKEKGLEKGNGRHSTLRGRERSVFNQTNIGQGCKSSAFRRNAAIFLRLSDFFNECLVNLRFQTYSWYNLMYTVLIWTITNLLCCAYVLNFDWWFSLQSWSEVLTSSDLIYSSASSSSHWLAQFEIFKNLLTAPRSFFNTDAQVARRNRVQITCDIGRSSRATCCVPRGMKGQLSYWVWQSWNRIYFSFILLTKPVINRWMGDGGGGGGGKPWRLVSEIVTC